MRKAELIKKMIPIYLASCLAWIHNIVYTPLGYMYNTWPNQDALITLHPMECPIRLTFGTPNDSMNSWRSAPSREIRAP